MRLYFILFIFFLLVSFSFQKTVLAANHVKENTGKCIKGDCINGNGTFDDGVRIYTGQFKDGKYNGYGRSQKHVSGTKYEGEWSNGLPNGQGTLTTKDGKKYVGEWKNNKHHGQGTFTLPDGRKYVGEWKDGKRNGQGTFTFPNGRKYVGEWKDGKRNGQGTSTFADGDKFVGEYKDNYRNGQGTYTFANGDKKVGEWKDNKEVQGKIKFIETAANKKKRIMEEQKTQQARQQTRQKAISMYNKAVQCYNSSARARQFSDYFRFIKLLKEQVQNGQKPYKDLLYHSEEFLTHPAYIRDCEAIRLR